MNTHLQQQTTDATKTPSTYTWWVTALTLFPVLNRMTLTYLYEPLSMRAMELGTGNPLITAFILSSSLLITAALLITPVIMDRRDLKSTNRFAPHWAWGVFLAPIYLYLRAKHNNHSHMLLFLWVTASITNLLIP